MESSSNWDIFENCNFQNDQGSQVQQNEEIKQELFSFNCSPRSDDVVRQDVLLKNDLKKLEKKSEYFKEIQIEDPSTLEKQNKQDNQEFYNEILSTFPLNNNNSIQIQQKQEKNEFYENQQSGEFFPNENVLNNQTEKESNMQKQIDQLKQENQNLKQENIIFKNQLQKIIEELNLVKQNKMDDCNNEKKENQNGQQLSRNIEDENQIENEQESNLNDYEEHKVDQEQIEQENNNNKILNKKIKKKKQGKRLEKTVGNWYYVIKCDFKMNGDIEEIGESEEQIRNHLDVFFPEKKSINKRKKLTTQEQQQQQEENKKIKQIKEKHIETIKLSTSEIYLKKDAFIGRKNKKRAFSNKTKQNLIGFESVTIKDYMKKFKKLYIKNFFEKENWKNEPIKQINKYIEQNQDDQEKYDEKPSYLDVIKKLMENQN